MAQDVEIRTRRYMCVQLGRQWESLNDAQTSNPALFVEGTLKASWGLPEPRCPGDLQQGSWCKGPDSQMEPLLSPQKASLWSPGESLHAYRAL